MQPYFDNAATSFPKPDEVYGAMESYLLSCGASPGRGAYSQADEATSILDSCRKLLCELVNAPSHKHCIFTHNCTDALNLAICGTISYHLTRDEPVHVVTTAMDHNSVLRPLSFYAQQGVEFTVVKADKSGWVNPSDIKNSITDNTRLVAVAHGSNVTGSIQDLIEIGNLCGEIPFLVDAAQTMGHAKIDVQSMKIDLLAFPGHKGLLGPLGTGGLIIRPSIEKNLLPHRTGGTGSQSEHPVQPESLPDKYESGSHNMVGIAGLLASTQWILDKGIENLQARELSLCEQFINELKKVDGVRIVGPQTTENRCGVFSLVFDDCPHLIANQLEDSFGICSRSGLHCAPYAHETMGTTSLGGTVRVSFSPFHTEEDISYLVQSISNCTQKCLA